MKTDNEYKFNPFGSVSQINIKENECPAIDKWNLLTKDYGEDDNKAIGKAYSVANWLQETKKETTRVGQDSHWLGDRNVNYGNHGYNFWFMELTENEKKRIEAVADLKLPDGLAIIKITEYTDLKKELLLSKETIAAIKADHFKSLEFISNQGLEMSKKDTTIATQEKRITDLEEQIKKIKGE